MKQPKNTPLLRCPAGYLVSPDAEKRNEINSSRQSKINNESNSDIIAGIVFVLVFVLALFVRLML